jgi:thiamine biosynthesis protein ThiS
MEGTVELLLNGELRPGIRAGTVAELVLELGLPGPALLIEWNGTALHRDEWERTPLKAGDRLEFVRIVAGG